MSHGKDWFQISWLDLRVCDLEQMGSEIGFWSRKSGRVSGTLNSRLESEFASVFTKVSA